MIKKKHIIKEIKEYILIIGLSILSALSYLLFIVNNKFAPSGINGLGVMLQYKLGFSIGYFSLIINIPLCILAFIFVNKSFAVKSFIYTLFYSISFVLLSKVDLSRFAYDAGGTDTILPVLAASIVSGFIYGVVFRINASTGGTDIIAKLINKIRPEFNYVWIIFLLNVVVAAISYFVYGEEDLETHKIVYDLKPVILCITYSFVSSRLGNSILEGTQKAIKFDIVTNSNQSEELSQDIINNLHHGVTLTKVTGMYSHQDKEMLTCVVNKHQINDFEKIINKYPGTFAYISTVNSTIGNFKKQEQKIFK